MSIRTAPQALVVPLSSTAATLDVAGGKGANLSRLIRAGFPVPDGFVITTAAYEAYVAVNGLNSFIRAALDGVTVEYEAALDAASVAIRARFAQSQMPAQLATAVRNAYVAQPVSRMAVAVRSSATAEDLPDLSFAGQQDTFLNVVGPEAVLRAVVDCWSSLWTARAIGYRARNAIPQDALSLAVVVQAMVDADAAGVLFTANPLTGRRTEFVIDATLGLGDVLVGGQVEPDQYVIAARPRRIIEKRLGDKLGGQREVQALPDSTILELVALGDRIARALGAPQDIEWTWASERLAIVQARPITSLFPLPEGCDPEGDLRVYASIGAFQGMLDPITLLGQDTLKVFAAQVASYAGYHYSHETVPALRTAGERLFVDLTGAIRNGFGRKVLLAALGQVEPGTGAAIRQLLDDPRLTPTAAGLSAGAIRRLVPILAPIAARAVSTLLAPEHNRRLAQQAVEQAVAHFEARALASRTLAERLTLLEDVADVLRTFMFAQLLPRLVAGLGMLNQVLHLAALTPEGSALALEITRGLPHNVTTEMDLALWETACLIRSDVASSTAFLHSTGAALATDYLSGSLPPVAQETIAAFMSRYGMRGLGELDLGRQRWREDPSAVMETLRSYQQITDPNLAPDAVFGRAAASAEQAIEQLADALRHLPHGRLKAARARWAARRVRALAGLRETPKFTIIRLFGLARTALLESGSELVAAGRLESPHDIFYLTLTELKTLGQDGAAPFDLHALVASRQERSVREQRRRQIPRVFLNDGQAFYEGALASQEGADNALRGSGVSPGIAEGIVRVVLDPRGAQLAPGEILVCPGTDPSWTPLFLAAGGLVMEVGGMMTHGSVVAREYGIPAVVGVTQATTRLLTGMRVRVDGTTGRVTPLV